jgi:hypothetical protein
VVASAEFDVEVLRLAHAATGRTPLGEPFLPLKGSDSKLCGYPSTGDPSTPQPSILMIRKRWFR